jgi:hypothetical protein
MTRYESTWNTPKALTSDLTNFHALFLAIIRFAVEKYGGAMETDLATGTTSIEIPDWAREACFQELGELVGPGKPLNGYLSFLEG